MTVFYVPWSLDSGLFLATTLDTWLHAGFCLSYRRARSESGSYSRLIDFVYHPTLGLRGIKKKKKDLLEVLEGAYRRAHRWPTSPGR